MSGVVSFYREDEKPFGAFSNFYPGVIDIEGIAYPTVEHYINAKKFTDENYQALIRSQSTPNKAKILGDRIESSLSSRYGNSYQWRMELDRLIRERKGVRIREDWEKVKSDVMYAGLKAKFTQHPELKLVLSSTKNARIEYVSPTDLYWGTGEDGKGANQLGLLLMKLRDEFTS